MGMRAVFVWEARLQWQAGHVPNAEICRSRKTTSLCLQASKTSELPCHLHF
jgi:hypothetical protein